MPSRPWSALLATGLLCLLIVPLGAANGSGSAGLPAWGTEPSPNAGFPRNVLARMDGNDQDFGLRTTAFDLARHFQPAQIWHSDVEYYQVRLQAFNLFYRVSSIHRFSANLPSFVKFDERA